MKPLRLDLSLTRSDDAHVHLVFQRGGVEFDLSIYQLTAEVHPVRVPTGTPIAPFTVTPGPGLGEVRLTLEEEITAVLPARAFWSFRAYHQPTDFWQTWLAGSVKTDFQAAAEATPNDAVIEVGPTEIQVLVAANIGPPGEKGELGDQGVSGPGVPAGGTTGQLLGKLSDDDYDTGWVDP